MDGDVVQVSQPGTAVYARYISHISAESNIDSPPSQYLMMNGGDVFQSPQSETLQVNVVAHLENARVTDSTSIADGDELTDVEANQSNDDESPPQNNHNSAHNTASATAGNQPIAVDISANRLRRFLSTTKHLVRLKYLVSSFIGMLAALVVVIFLQMALQLSSANAVPAVSSIGAENPTKFDSYGHVPPPTELLTSNPNAKFICESYEGYWSEEYQKCYILSEKPKVFNDAKQDCENHRTWKLGYPNNASEKNLMGHIYNHLFQMAEASSGKSFKMKYSPKFFLGVVKSGKNCDSIDGKVHFNNNEEFAEINSLCGKDGESVYGVLDSQNLRITFSEDDLKYYLCTFDGVEFSAVHYY